MRQLEQLREEARRERELQRQLRAVTLLQSHWRRYLSQKMYRQLKSELELQRQRLRLEKYERAAIKIQVTPVVTMWMSLKMFSRRFAVSWLGANSNAFA